MKTSAPTWGTVLSNTASKKGESTNRIEQVSKPPDDEKWELLFSSKSEKWMK